MPTSREDLGALLDELVSESWADGRELGEDGTGEKAAAARARIDAALDEVFAELDRLRKEAARAHPDT